MAKTRKRAQKKLKRRTRNLKTKKGQRGGFREECHYENQYPEEDTSLPITWTDDEGNEYDLENIDELPNYAYRKNLDLDREYIWVITVDEPWVIYYTDPNPGDLEPGGENYFSPDGSSTDFIKHSQVAMGMDVKCAGTFVASKQGGFTLYVTNQSGHYRPDYFCLEDESSWNEENGENGDREPYDALEVFRYYGYKNLVSNSV
jgi:hypothetical protein